MRSWALVGVAIAMGCGPAGAPQSDYPTLENTAPAPVSADAGPRIESRLPTGGPSCMPAGQYDVDLDLSKASYEVGGGMDLDYCQKQSEAALPALGASALEIGYPDGKLQVLWPEARAIKPLGPCGFEDQIGDVPIQLTFVDGLGSGTANFAMVTPNHPDEVCKINGVLVHVAPTGAR